jgi:hypothetical protein
MRTLLDRLISLLFKTRILFSPYKIKVASSEKEIDLACDLRRKIFAKEGVSDLDIPLRDEYDSHSVFFLCFYKKQPVGASRLILPNGELQALKAFNVKFPRIVDQSKCSEVSGLVVTKRHQRRSRLPIWGLHLLTYEYAKRNNIDWIIGIANPRLVESYNKAGGEFNIMQDLPLENSHKKARERFPRYYKKYPDAKVFYLKVNSYSPLAWAINHLKKRR